MYCVIYYCFIIRLILPSFHSCAAYCITIYGPMRNYNRCACACIVSRCQTSAARRGESGKVAIPKLFRWNVISSGHAIVLIIIK